MASKIILVLSIFVTLASIVLAMPSAMEEDRLKQESEISKIREAIIEQDVQIGMDSHGRFLAGGPNGFGNLSAILSTAPNNSASLTFIPLATVLFGTSG